MSLSNPKTGGSIGNHLKVVNGYLWDKFCEIDPGLVAVYGTRTPIFPISDAHSDDSFWKDKPYLIYNSLYNRPIDQFYVIKRDTIFYGLKADIYGTFEWGRSIQAVLDRQDDTAKEINAWNRVRNNDETNWYQPVFFHNLRVFQIERTGGGSYMNTPLYTTDFMVRVDYHITESLDDSIKRLNP